MHYYGFISRKFYQLLASVGLCDIVACFSYETEAIFQFSDPDYIKVVCWRFSRISYTAQN